MRFWRWLARQERRIDRAVFFYAGAAMVAFLSHQPLMAWTFTGIAAAATVAGVAAHAVPATADHVSEPS